MGQLVDRSYRIMVSVDQAIMPNSPIIDWRFRLLRYAPGCDSSMDDIAAGRADQFSGKPSGDRLRGRCSFASAIRPEGMTGG
ncbi:MAG TPA: hypothetical protein VF463_19130 [Sphingobium sp.]